MSLGAAERFLVKSDPILGKIIKENGHLDISTQGNYFVSLCESIISQQISVKAAATIYSRFQNKTMLRPEKVLKLSDEEAKLIGLSGQKRQYVRDLARHFVEDSAIFDHLDSLNDDEVVKELTRIKGIGVWTAQMFLMCTLGRPDVFAADDLGILNAITKIYDLHERPKRIEALQFAERWVPYRTSACYHLWHHLDNKPASS